MNAKIRDAQKQLTPNMLVVGDREVEQGSIALRLRSGENSGAVSIEKFIARVREDVQAGE